MGRMYYGNVGSFEFDDHALTHLRTVILGKMNLQESMAFTWVEGERQHSIWLHPAIPLHFEFDGQETPALDSDWLEELIALSNSASGLRYLKGNGETR